MASGTCSSRIDRLHPLLSRHEIEYMIAQGHNIIIVNQSVLKVNGWLKYHPGGEKAILHMVGRDATDEVNALHGDEALHMMERYKVGRIEGIWMNFLPPIQGGKFGVTLSKPMLPNPDLEIQMLRDSVQSRSPSPILDTGITPSLQGSTKISDNPANSCASVVDGGEILDGMTYLDIETKKKVRLDLERYPAVDVATQHTIAQKYRELDEQVRARGLYKCNYNAYSIEIMRYSLLFAAMLFFLQRGNYAVSGLFLAIFWQQLVFSAHDAGHLAITHNFHIDTLIGIFIADFCGGLSITWWKHNHNVHHIVTNAPEHDPDIEHMPFLAISHRLLSSLRSTYYNQVMKYDAFAKIFISVQAWLYYPIMGVARFNLYALSWDYLIARRGPRTGPALLYWLVEIACQVCFWIWFGYGILYKTIPTNWDRFVFIMVSHTVSAILHVQITLSHFAMSTADLGPQESFAQKMLRTTMDVDCPQWLDFFHGGLQFQVVHHLFPRIPRHNLRETQKLVREFCEEVGIPYAYYGFADGNSQVIGRLAEVSRQASMLAKCQRSIARHGQRYYKNT